MKGLTVTLKCFEGFESKRFLIFSKTSEDFWELKKIFKDFNMTLRIISNFEKYLKNYGAFQMISTKCMEFHGLSKIFN